MRFRTSADIPGTEKIVVSSICSELSHVQMDIEVHEISAFGGDDANMLAPMSAFMVKGWSRTLGMVACLLHAYADEDVLQARSCSHNKRYVFFLCQ